MNKTEAKCSCCIEEGHTDCEIIEPTEANDSSPFRHYDEILDAVSSCTASLMKCSVYNHSIFIQALRELGRAACANRVYVAQIVAEKRRFTRFEIKYYWDLDMTGFTEELSCELQLTLKNRDEKSWKTRLLSGEAAYLYSNDLYDDFVGFDAPCNSFYKSGYQFSCLAVPLFIYENFWGYLGLDSKDSREWSDIELKAVKTTARIFSAAIYKMNFEKELIEARNEAEKSNKLKSEFLAQMSHEIRTPVNTILNFTSLVREELKPIIDNEIESYFQIISDGGRRLIRTIDMIINMSQFQSGNFEANPVSIDLAGNFFEMIIREYRPAANEKGLKIWFRKETDNAPVYADPYTLNQIFSNLIDNALKYTAKGEIEIKLYKSIGDEVMVDVRDTGIGISEDYIPQLFTPFSQEEMGYTRHYEGNGLGLALVKKYLEINQAEILVDSQKGKGSTFTVIFKNRLNR